MQHLSLSTLFLVFLIYFIVLLVVIYVLIHHINQNNTNILKNLLEEKLSIKSLSNLFDKHINFLCSSVTLCQNTVINNNHKNSESIKTQLMQIMHLNENKIEAMRKTLEDQLSHFRFNNRNDLKDIQTLVQEKLSNTLEKRLGESFNIVNNHLAMVYKGIGEMQNLANNVNDFKKALLNVKTTGIWGEIQLENILQQTLSKEQYSKNVKTNELNEQRVDFAVKIPINSNKTNILLMPIDAKVPLTEYYKLIKLYEQSDNNAAKKQLKILMNNVQKEAKSISKKYINPPFTTDFAVMFLPMESLYAEIMRIPEALEKIQRESKIIITSPTTLLALLNSVQVGFKTFAIEKHSNQVWKLLDSIKYEFNNFISLINKTKIKIDQASKTISDAEYKGNLINNKLQNVDQISQSLKQKKSF